MVEPHTYGILERPSELLLGPQPTSSGRYSDSDTHPSFVSSYTVLYDEKSRIALL